MRTDPLLTPPHDIGLETGLLCSLLLSPDEEAISLVAPEHFYRSAHQHIYRAILAIVARREPVDALLLVEQLKSSGKLEDSGGVSYVSKLLDEPPSADPAVYARKIADLWRLRSMIEVCHATFKRAFAAGADDAIKISDYLRAELDRIGAGDSGGWRHIAETITECVDRCDALQTRSGITGVPSGYSHLDHYTCGFQGGDLIILAARPSMGKTAFALNCMFNGAREGFKTGKLSLEMSSHQLGNRALAGEARVNSLKFRSGRFANDDWDRIIAAAGRLSELGVWIDDAPKASYLEVERKARQIVSRHGASSLWIDYLGFLDGDKAGGRVNEVQTITRSLKSAAKVLNIPIILLCQLSRACEQRPNKRPILSDLRDSGAIEQDADIVAFLYRDEVYNPEGPYKGMAELILAKHRNGPTGTVKLAWQEAFTRFENLAQERREW